MPLSYINPVFNNNITTETETLSVTGVTTLGDSPLDTVVINARTISIPNDININSNTLFIKNSNSQIGIGTNDPLQLLHINGNAIISGFLGIGTVSPIYKFHLVNTVAQGQNTPFQIEDNGTLTYYPNLASTNFNPAVNAADKALIATNGTINTGSLFIGTWSNNSIGAGIRLISTGVNLFGNINIDNGALFVDGTNNRIGINNATPNVPLDIQSDTSAFGINIRGRALDNVGLLRFLNNAESMRHSLGLWTDDSLMFLNSSSNSIMSISQTGQLSAVIPGSTTLYQGFLCRAWVNFNGTSAANITGTYSQSGTTVTVTLTGHGLLQGHIINVTITSGTAVSGTYTVTGVTSSSIFTYTAGTSLTVTGNITINRRTVRGSGNISNVTYSSAGDYIVNFTNAMPDVNYCTMITGGGTTSGFLSRDGGEVNKTVNAIRVYTATQSGGTTTAADVTQVNVTIFR